MFFNNLFHSHKNKQRRSKPLILKPFISDIEEETEIRAVSEEVQETISPTIEKALAPPKYEVRPGLGEK